MSHHDLLLVNAEWLHGQNQFHGSTLLAHVAVEVFADNAFLVLFFRAFGELEDDWSEPLPARTFMDKGTRVLWRMLTGQDPAADKSVWKPYAAAVEVRNKVAHGAKWPVPEESRTSIDAVRAFIAHLDLAVAPVRDELERRPG